MLYLWMCPHHAVNPFSHWATGARSQVLVVAATGKLIKQTKDNCCQTPVPSLSVSHPETFWSWGIRLCTVSPLMCFCFVSSLRLKEWELFSTKCCLWLCCLVQGHPASVWLSVLLCALRFGLCAVRVVSLHIRLWNSSVQPAGFLELLVNLHWCAFNLKGENEWS